MIETIAEFKERVRKAWPRLMEVVADELTQQLGKLAANGWRVKPFRKLPFPPTCNPKQLLTEDPSFPEGTPEG